MSMIPNPVHHPLAAPTVNDGAITLDMYAKQPTRVTRLVEDLTLGRFIMDRIFTRAGAISGGAVLYDEVTANDIYTTRDVELVAPGDEFPLLTSDRPVPKVATPGKWGGKWSVTDEARDRNDLAAVTRHSRKVGNTIVRKTNLYAVATLDAAVTAHSRTAVGHSWSAAVPNGSTPTAPGDTPFGDIAAARADAIDAEMGIEYDTLIVNQQEEQSLLNFAQFDAGKLREILGQIGITELFTSPRVAAGAPYLVASGQVGEYRVEKALGTESWREPKTQETWFQTDVRPVAYVTNPFAVLKLTGVA